MKKVLICGGTGFIGRNMVLHFASLNYEVHATCFKRKLFEIEGVKWHNVDLRNPEKIEELLSLNFDTIIQAAATTSGAKDIVERPYIHTTDNAVMNSYLIRAAFEKHVKNFIFFSCTVMYNSSSTPLKETDFKPELPLHERYFGVGNTKIYIEKMCEFYGGLKNNETKFTAIRHSNIYGPFDKYDLERSHFFGANITKVLSNTDGILKMWGTGEEERDLLHASDLTNFVELAIQNQTHKYRLYNCGLGQAHSVKSIIEKIIKYSGKEIKLEHDLTMPTIKTSLFLDCTLASNELGWKPKIDIDEGIKETIKWWNENIKE